MADTIPPRDIANLVKDAEQAAALLVENIFGLIALAVDPLPVLDRTDLVKEGTDAARINIQTLVQTLGLLWKYTIKPRMNDLAPLARELSKDLDQVIISLFGGALNELVKGYESGIKGLNLTTDDGMRTAADTLLARAFELGMGAHFLAIIPELGYFTKHLGLAQTAALMAQLAGFDVIVEAFHTPFVKAVLARPSTYGYNRAYPTALPDHISALQLAARGILSDQDLSYLLLSEGFEPRWQLPLSQGKYRPLSPFVLASAYVDVEFPEDQVRAVLVDGGYRPDAIQTIIEAFKTRSIQSVRQQYLAAIVHAASAGDKTDTDLLSSLDSLGFSDDAKQMVRLTVAERKLERMTTTYRKSVSEGYQYGLVSDEDYVNNLVAIGIDQAVAESDYAADSMRRFGKLEIAATRDAERQTAQIQRAAFQAALLQYHGGAIDAVALASALAAAGMSPIMVPLAVSIAQAKSQGSQVLTNGLLLSREASQLLKEQVAALKEQAVKKLLDLTNAKAELTRLGIPAVNVQALISAWAAQLKIQPLQPI